jgi:hypothetical protein
VVDAERVVEARVRRARIHQVREAELADEAQPLERLRVHDADGRGIDADGVPERVPDDVGPGGWCHGGRLTGRVLGGNRGKGRGRSGRQG